jgi:hypothetical protein
LTSEQIGSLEREAKAKEAGVDGIVVQGREAGGHVIGQVTRYPQLIPGFIFDEIQCIIEEKHLECPPRYELFPGPCYDKYTRLSPAHGDNGQLNYILLSSPRICIGLPLVLQMSPRQVYAG